MNQHQMRLNWGSDSVPSFCRNCWMRLNLGLASQFLGFSMVLRPFSFPYSDMNLWRELDFFPFTCLASPPQTYFIYFSMLSMACWICRTVSFLSFLSAWRRCCCSLACCALSADSIALYCCREASSCSSQASLSWQPYSLSSISKLGRLSSASLKFLRCKPSCRSASWVRLYSSFYLISASLIYCTCELQKLPIFESSLSWRRCLILYSCTIAMIFSQNFYTSSICSCSLYSTVGTTGHETSAQSPSYFSLMLLTSWLSQPASFKYLLISLRVFLSRDCTKGFLLGRLSIFKSRNPWEISLEAHTPQQYSASPQLPFSTYLYSALLCAWVLQPMQAGSSSFPSLMNSLRFLLFRVPSSQLQCLCSRSLFMFLPCPGRCQVTLLGSTALFLWLAGLAFSLLAWLCLRGDRLFFWLGRRIMRLGCWSVVGMRGSLLGFAASIILCRYLNI